MSNLPIDSADNSKSLMHPRNLHRSRYDFDLLTEACPELSGFVITNAFKIRTIDFADPLAIRMLNKALLKQYYHIHTWDLPLGYLCPPIPGRADYIHHVADLLAASNKGKVPTGLSVRILDIGTGASCIYPLIGHKAYGWHFTGVDIDPVALKSANQIIDSNASMKGAVECRLQSDSSNIFSNILKGKEVFDLSVCNPPFHASPEEAAKGTARKLHNLKGGTSSPVLNFGGQSNELYYQGGEAEFIRRMIKQSSEIPGRCLWFTTLTSQKSNLFLIEKYLKKVKATDVRIIEMAQGQKHSRVIAWTFLPLDQIDKWYNR